MRALPKVDRRRTDRQATSRRPGAAPVFSIHNRLLLEGRPTLVDGLRIEAARLAGLTAAPWRHRPSTIYRLDKESFGVTGVRTGSG
ncbi:MAG: hypothetical protein NZ533_11780 [Casimicrobiaceae bacterium]|nr:hypothetical protein [Casimicrobiaceae bacterium]